MLRRLICILTLTVLSQGFGYGHSHTHIGLNPDGISGSGDDKQLWIFATPEQPQWNVIEMLPTGEFIGDRQIYAAVLDCWHSAHPDNGSYQLDFNNESIEPEWRIGLKRISFSDPLNFWMEDEASTLQILASDGGTYAFEQPDWDVELPNGVGGSGAWHFHNHTEFLALADGPGTIFSATFTVFDMGSTGFVESAQYTVDFVTVPEPVSIGLLGAGLFSIIRSRKTSF